jgi:glucosamine--fructose-6-phosphate aminotransferase (isomerizing)
MCGIVGYIGKTNAVEFVMQGLQSLEYRGYDSAGVSTIVEGRPVTTRQVGRVEALKNELESQPVDDTHIAIGHTRWATHGAPSVLNAHPHCNSDQTIFIVHNGIIENYQELRAHLQSVGYKFISETDTEVIPHLIDHNLKKIGDFQKAFEKTVEELEGAYAVAAMYTAEPDCLYVARLSSPLVIGVGDGEHFLASDATALMDRTKKVIYLDDYEIARICKEEVKIQNIQKAVQIQRKAEMLDYDAEKAGLGDYPHYMLKEIHEGPQTIQSAIRGRIRAESNTVMLGGLTDVAEQLRFIDRIVIVACGTSYYAGLVGEYLIEEIAGIPVEVQLASEFKYRNEPFSRSTALFAISQSGETADTIAALKKVESYGVLRLGIVNVVGSTIARMTDAGVYCHAGPEQSVASTKAFIAQVTVLTEIALHLSRGRTPLYKPVMNELQALPNKVNQILSNTSDIERLAHKYKNYVDFMFIGRKYGFPCALEGALKLKEISYIHAEGYSAGEMKHGPLAMIDDNFPTFAVATDDSLTEKTISNIEEIRARKGPVLAIATEGNKSVAKVADDVLYIPKTLEQTQSLLVVVVMQLFAYYVAVAKGHDVDRPRNLAKSVTVE